MTIASDKENKITVKPGEIIILDHSVNDCLKIVSRYCDENNLKVIIEPGEIIVLDSRYLNKDNIKYI